MHKFKQTIKPWNAFSSYATTIDGEYFTPSDYETRQTNDNSPEVALENVDDNGVDCDRLISFRRAQGRQIQRAIDYVDRSHKEDLFSKFEHILRQLGMEINKIRDASSSVQLDLLLQNCINERISPYQKLTKKLNYGPNDIAKVNDFDAVIKRLKKRFIKNTGRAQYYNTRFGETPPFNLIEVEKLAKAISKIEFVGAADILRRGISKYGQYSFPLHQKRRYGRNVREMRVQTSKIDLHKMTPKTRKKLILKDINKAFTRDVFIDCRLHKPSEIQEIFLLVQGLKS
ncbi:hypothetical protein E3Q17_04134 [Wallemia mellicola]|uniref:Uncharacterized protein n=1 Tax=Wallemia mellicola TaxID=1708541 RepID=A0A4T0NG24_9BASI|nr:hypothetical protein E3Q17_04134 [Wallemia mellicola]